MNELMQSAETSNVSHDSEVVTKGLAKIKQLLHGHILEGPVRMVSMKMNG